MTGSNAHLLSGELASSLTGRHHTIEMFPFDLAEYRIARPDATLDEYLEGGGFPGVVASPDRDMLLRGYFQDIVERDMRERVAARSSLPLRHLVQIDTGLRRVSISVTGRDLSKQLECAVGLLLRRRFGRVSYWRGDGAA